LARNFEVCAYQFWQHETGQTASIHGAVPWTSALDKSRWKVVEKGFTLYNPNTNQYGIGRKPFDTRQEAQAYADTHRAPTIGYGD